MIRAEADQTIGEALRAGGTEVVMSCGQGVCGTCELSVLRGEPDHRDSILDEQERDEGACVYPCVSRSLSKTLVLDL
ncbi:2Fe-2S iron-sulfur cluster binding domain-containing protein [Nesterenkonia pannonica]|uniref:2Fe-2S iron-sulfur cluster-binding protein n=1 Tax=Nesterenkonia pannonica TaxID=1548602 RepID=UPI002164EEE5|nr:2Fe-2S iron-sulfur cluster binding domain-containing protein [Nesterenkonia pannonica]